MRHYEKVRILLLSRLFGFPIIRNSHTNSALMHVNKERFETTENNQMQIDNQGGQLQQPMGGN